MEKITMTNEKPNRKLLAVLIAVYVLILLWVIVFKCNYNEGLHIKENSALTILERLTYKLIPFEKFILAVKGGGILALIEILALIFNVVCFMPFGALLCFFTEKRGLIIATGAFFSLSVEVFQLFSCWGGPDYIDLILNTLGAALGVLFYKHLRPRLTCKTINRITAALLAVFAPLATFAVINSIANFPV